jgi:hypothetical protein
MEATPSNISLQTEFMDVCTKQQNFGEKQHENVIAHDCGG